MFYVCARTPPWRKWLMALHGRRRRGVGMEMHVTGQMLIHRADTRRSAFVVSIALAAHELESFRRWRPRSVTLSAALICHEAIVRQTIR
jgi:hypothetical protein